MIRIQSAAVALLIPLAVVLAGCGGEKSYHLSGTVSFQGKPVPAGHIVFEPDASAGNSGPAAFAKIKDGHYDTRILDGRGTVGGPHLVLIHGRDGIPRGELLNGLPLFRDYNTKVDLPKANGKQDFEVTPGDRG
jgi:hypothetical protein